MGQEFHEDPNNTTFEDDLHAQQQQRPQIPPPPEPPEIQDIDKVKLISNIYVTPAREDPRLPVEVAPIPWDAVRSISLPLTPSTPTENSIVIIENPKTKQQQHIGLEDHPEELIDIYQGKAAPRNMVAFLHNSEITKQKQFITSAQKNIEQQVEQATATYKEQFQNVAEPAQEIIEKLGPKVEKIKKRRKNQEEFEKDDVFQTMVLGPIVNIYEKIFEDGKLNNFNEASETLKTATEEHQSKIQALEESAQQSWNQFIQTNQDRLKPDYVRKRVAGLERTIVALAMTNPLGKTDAEYKSYMKVFSQAVQGLDPEDQRAVQDYIALQQYKKKYQQWDAQYGHFFEKSNGQQNPNGAQPH